MLHTIDIDLKHTVFYQEVFAEGEESGREGGRMEGRNEGRHEGEAKVLMRLLRRRFGTLAAERESAVRALPEPQLEALSDALLDFAGPEDFSAWLAKHGKP